MSSLQKSIMKSRLPPISSASSRISKNAELRKAMRNKDYTPQMWDEYFTEKKDVQLDDGNVFRVYLGKRLVNDCGGSAADGKTEEEESRNRHTPTNDFDTDQPQSLFNTDSVPLLVLLHGGGFSALTWSHFNTEILSLIRCNVLAIDLRGHGDTITDDDTNLSADVLSNDVAKVLHQLYPEDMPNIMLVGHSMGGAICVHIAHMELIPTLIGCIVIDVVEGTAMEALTSMQSFLRSRPTHFKSIQQAIEWSIRSGQIRNVNSAKVSMPGQIINCTTNKLATNELPLPDNLLSPTSPTFSDTMTISEDAELEMCHNQTQQQQLEQSFQQASTTTSNISDNKKYTWRIDLSKSETFWPGWFQGLSEKFLNVRVPKLLLLASIDGLDRTLTVGQMQGKFQMQVLARCGHAVHEDRPHEVAEVIASYMVRNKFTEATGNFLPVLSSC